MSVSTHKRSRFPLRRRPSARSCGLGLAALCVALGAPQVVEAVALGAPQVVEAVALGAPQVVAAAAVTTDAAACRRFVSRRQTAPRVAAVPEADRVTRLAFTCECAGLLADEVTSILDTTPKDGKVDDAVAEMDEITADFPFSGLSSSVPTNAYLLDTHVSYQRLKGWRRGLFDKVYETPTKASNALLNDDDASQCEVDVSSTGDLLHAAMEARGMSRFATAVLVSGPIWSDRGSGSSMLMSEEGETAVNASAHVEWETKHFELTPNRWDVRLVGRFGIQPTATLVEDKPTATLVDEKTTAVAPVDPGLQFKQAFIWDIGGGTNVHLGRAMFSGTFRVGQTVLTSDTTISGKGDDARLTIPLGGTNRSEWFWQGGLELRYFREDVEVMHEQTSALSPLFIAQVGVRRNNRFKSADTLVAFDSSEKRYFARFMLNALEIIDKRAKGEAKTFTVAFGVESEWGGGPGGVPAFTRITLTGDLDLLKAIRGGS